MFSLRSKKKLSLNYPCCLFLSGALTSVDFSQKKVKGIFIREWYLLEELW